MGLSPDIKRNFVTVLEIEDGQLHIQTGDYEKLTVQVDKDSIWFQFLPYLETYDMLYLTKKVLKEGVLDDSGMMVIEPHYLIPVTTVINAYTCPRKVYVQHMGITDPTSPMERLVEGNLLHDVFAQKLSLEIPVKEGIKHAIDVNYVNIVTNAMSTERLQAYLEHAAAPLDTIVGTGKAEIDYENWRFGMHGKLDGKIGPMIIELKSSRIPEDRPYFEHNLQMNFYLLMIREREPDCVGSILYVNNGTMGIKQHSELKHRPMLVARNWAYLVITGRYLPGLLRGDAVRSCKWCYQKMGCQALCAGLNTQRDCDMCAVRDGCTQTKWRRDELEYFERMTQALSLEEMETQKLRYHYSRVGTGDKEALDELIDSGLALVTDKKLGQEVIRGEVFTSFSHSAEITVFRRGDFLSAYSADEFHPTVTRYESAIIYEITEDRIRVRSSNFLPECVIFVPSSSISNMRRSRGAVFRATQINDSLMRLVKTGVALGEKKRVELDVTTLLRDYNEYQMDAISSALATDDIYLIQGPAGTGKTSVIVEIINQLHLQGKSVLACAYTNMAVDNIGLKLKEANIPFTRLGRENSVNPELVEFLPTDSEAFSRLFSHFSSSIILATTSTIAGDQYQGMVFDFAVIDEAAQMTEPDSLKPLLLARRGVLVGDHRQLPPVIISEEAKQLGLDDSMFERLVDKLQNLRFTPLLTQYRMNEEILRFPNQRFYGGVLQSSPSVAHQTLPMTKSEFVPESPYWVYHIDAPRLKPLSQINPYEAWVCAALVAELLQNGTGLRTEDIGIITPFRAQVGLLRRILPNVSVDTVDRFQGSEREVIIFSTITAREVPIVTDPRRMNVALTRAKKKLIVLVTNAKENPKTLCEHVVADAHERRLSTVLRGDTDDVISFYSANGISYDSVKSSLSKHLSAPDVASIPMGSAIAEADVTLQSYEIYVGSIPLPFFEFEGGNHTCGICFVGIRTGEEVVMCYSCEHLYHSQHLIQALGIKGMCPICRVSMKLIENY